MAERWAYLEYLRDQGVTVIADDRLPPFEIVLVSTYRDEADPDDVLRMSAVRVNGTHVESAQMGP